MKQHRSFGGEIAAHRSDVLGRSAVTGTLILKPASKQGSISLRRAMAAVDALNQRSKKK